MFVCLSGSFPFGGDSAEELIRCVVNDEPNFIPSAWENISPEARSLLMRLLEKDPNKRITVKEAMQEEWLRPITEQREKRTKRRRSIARSVLDMSPRTFQRRFSAEGRLVSDPLDLTVDVNAPTQPALRAVTSGATADSMKEDALLAVTFPGTGGVIDADGSPNASPGPLDEDLEECVV